MKKKSHKELPRTKTQKQFEREMKFSYYSMLKNMGKTLIHQLSKFEMDDTIKPTDTRTF